MHSNYTLIFWILLLCGCIFADVPTPHLQHPAVPYLNHAIWFQPLEIEVFGPDVSGMIPNHYSDVQWNPAFLTSLRQRSIYLGLAPGTNEPLGVTPYLDQLQSATAPASDYAVYPRWYNQTIVNPLNTTPIYQLAALLPLPQGWKISIFNRSFFDYGDFRANDWWYGAGRWAEYDNALSDIPDGVYEPERLAIDDNQQQLRGTQTEINIARSLSSELDAGLHVGHYIYGRDGTLYDSEWGNYPHSSFADLNDEDLDIDGTHWDIGGGLLYHTDEMTSFGISGGFSRGQADQENGSLDTSYSWSEEALATDYYNLYSDHLDRNETHGTKVQRSYLSLQAEHKIGDRWRLRGFLHHSWATADLNGGIHSIDTSYSDRVYDTWDSGQDRYFQQRCEAHSSYLENLTGSGTETQKDLRFFLSLIYQPADQWSFFTGIVVRNLSSEIKVYEDKNYRYSNYKEYTLYDYYSRRKYYRFHKEYEYRADQNQWSLRLPVGVKANVVKGLQILLGADIRLYFEDSSQQAQILYPHITERQWINGSLQQEDIQTDRYEEYQSDPATDFERSTNLQFGAIYQHPSGARLYIKSADELLDLNNWEIGFEFSW